VLEVQICKKKDCGVRDFFKAAEEVIETTKHKHGADIVVWHRHDLMYKITCATPDARQKVNDTIKGTTAARNYQNKLFIMLGESTLRKALRSHCTALYTCVQVAAKGKGKGTGRSGGKNDGPAIKLYTKWSRGVKYPEWQVSHDDMTIGKGCLNEDGTMSVYVLAAFKINGVQYQAEALIEDMKHRTCLTADADFFMTKYQVAKEGEI
jgi:hypothetical protein